MIIVLYRDKSATHPTAPATPWETVEHGAGWSTLYPMSRRGVRYHAWLAIDGDSPGLPPAAAGRGVWIVCCEDQRGATRLKTIAAESQNAWTLLELRAAEGAIATAIKNNWPRARDENGDPIPGPITMPVNIAGRAFHTLSTEHATLADVPDGGDEP